MLGFRNASTKVEQPPIGVPRLTALGIFGAFVATAALGPSLGTTAHSPFLLGAGNLPSDLYESFPWVSYKLPWKNIEYFILL